MKKFIFFSFVLILSLLTLTSPASAEKECSKGFVFSRYDGSCIPIECPEGTHYSSTGTLCLCNDESLQECKDLETGITSHCIPKNEFCIDKNSSEPSKAPDENNIPIVRNEDSTITATISKVTGTVTYKKGGEGLEIPLTELTILEEGDVIYTEFESAVLLHFGDFTQVMIHQNSAVKLDQSFSEDSIDKTKMYLDAGAVSAKVRHTPSPRSDFSVSTNGMASASIRNSAMSVTYDTFFGDTAVYVTEDKAFLKVDKNDDEFEVAEGQKTDVNDLGDTETDSYSLEELPPMELEFDDWVGVFDIVEPENPNAALILIVGAICIVLIGMGAGAIILFFFIRPSKKVLVVIGVVTILALCSCVIASIVFYPVIYSLIFNSAYIV